MGERTANITSGDIGITLNALAQTISERQQQMPKSSYTASLLADTNDLLCKKIVEEATEVILAVKDCDHDHIRYEAADLLYHLLVLLKREGISLGELAGELNARMH
ncbi:MAG: phosphoribosyl-ATP diphosphatase [Coriobacteriales bacterium]|nr:phosphoribosyl-ATP diphosphatase [Coriobacteriales bacterium]